MKPQRPLETLKQVHEAALEQARLAFAAELSREASAREALTAAEHALAEAVRRREEATQGSPGAVAGTHSVRQAIDFQAFLGTLQVEVARRAEAVARARNGVAAALRDQEEARLGLERAQRELELVERHQARADERDKQAEERREELDADDRPRRI